MSMQVQGLSQAIKKLQKYGDEVQRDTVKAMNTSMVKVQSEAKRNAPVNYGRLRSAIVTSKAKKTDLVAVTYADVDYAPFVEFGTKSKVDIPLGLESYALQFKSSGGNFDMLLADIKDWCAKKGIPIEAAYPIAIKIAREGVGAQPFLFPAWEKERPKFEQAVRELLQR